jgi:hypothetical protein
MDRYVALLLAMTALGNGGDFVLIKYFFKGSLERVLVYGVWIRAGARSDGEGVCECLMWLSWRERKQNSKAEVVSRRIKKRPRRAAEVTEVNRY